MTWPTVALGEMAKATGAKAGREGISTRVYSVTKHNGFVPSDEYFKKQVFSRDLSGYKRVRSGEFAYATIHLDEGSIGIAPEEALVSPMYTVFSTDKDRVDARYLLRFMKSPRALAVYPSLGAGSAERRKTISFQRLADLEVPLPPLPEQRRIAAILDQADSLRAKRRRAIAGFEQFQLAVFQQIFGDPFSSSRYPLRPFAERVEAIVGGRNLVGTEDSTNPMRVLKISSVTTLTYDEAESKPLPDGYEPPHGHVVRAGDLLFSRANTSELVGATVVVPETNGRTVLPDKLWRIALEDDHANTPVFNARLMQTPSFRSAVSNRATGSSGSMKNIAKHKLTEIEVIDPPLAIREQFERITAGAGTAAATSRSSLAELDALFSSLQSRAFRGEL